MKIYRVVFVPFIFLYIVVFTCFQLNFISDVESTESMDFTIKKNSRKEGLLWHWSFTCEAVVFKVKSVFFYSTKYVVDMLFVSWNNNYLAVKVISKFTDQFPWVWLFCFWIGVKFNFTYFIYHQTQTSTLKLRKSHRVY